MFLEKLLRTAGPVFGNFSGAPTNNLPGCCGPVAGHPAALQWRARFQKSLQRLCVFVGIPAVQVGKGNGTENRLVYRRFVTGFGAAEECQRQRSCYPSAS